MDEFKPSKPPSVPQQGGLPLSDREKLTRALLRLTKTGEEMCQAFTRLADSATAASEEIRRSNEQK